ncbi:MAG TPA: Gfo/Idh/MocA family oxidoreductase [Streptosporangiaceae bacterium]|nr:Gfo/Idh/MocA family oxidoreductase [Streptosporangiaceae bacterium]
MRGGISVAIVGLNFGARWVPHYLAHPDVGRVVLCERSADVLDRVGEAVGIDERHLELRTVLDDDTIDAVHLLTPLPVHAEQTIATMNAGKHCAVAVLPSLDIADLGEIVRLQKLTGKNYMMMETGAYTDAVIHLQQLVDSGVFGDVVFGRGEHHQDMSGWPGYWVGLPPLWYSTHALAPLLAVLRTQVTTVRALGAGRMTADMASRWGNPFPTEIGLYELAGSDAAIEVTRSMFQTTRASVESFSLWGTRHGLDWGRTAQEHGLFYTWGEMAPGGRGRPVLAEPYRPPDLSHTMPAPLRSLPQLYDGAVPRLVHEFVRSVVERRRPTLDAVVAANWTAAGFAAHQSAISGGQVVNVQSYA